MTERSINWVSGSGSVEEVPKLYFPPQGASRSQIIRTRLGNPPSPSAASSKTTPSPVRRSWTPMASWCPPFLVWGIPCRYQQQHCCNACYLLTCQIRSKNISFADKTLYLTSKKSKITIRTRAIFLTSFEMFHVHYITFLKGLDELGYKFSLKNV